MGRRRHNVVPAGAAGDGGWPGPTHALPHLRCSSMQQHRLSWWLKAAAGAFARLLSKGRLLRPSLVLVLAPCSAPAVGSFLQFQSETIYTVLFLIRSQVCPCPRRRGMQLVVCHLDEYHIAGAPFRCRLRLTHCLALAADHVWFCPPQGPYVHPQFMAPRCLPCGYNVSGACSLC